MEIGKINKLKVSELGDIEYSLVDELSNKALLRKSDITGNLLVGDIIEVFIYKDTDDRFIATTVKPHIQIEEFAFLKVKGVNKFGAFIDWGLSMDLLVPFSEQTGRLEEDNWYLFFLLQ